MNDEHEAHGIQLMWSPRDGKLCIYVSRDTVMRMASYLTGWVANRITIDRDRGEL